MLMVRSSHVVSMEQAVALTAGMVRSAHMDVIEPIESGPPCSE